jgi:hypothetical protein
MKDLIASMSCEDIRSACEIENYIATLDHVDIPTFHTLHAGVYTRTIILEAGQVASGVIISIPTTLIINGHLKLLIGNEVAEIKGFNAFIAEANRKQIALAIEKTTIAMIFKTDAKTVAEAEAEFTNEPERLASRLPSAINKIKQGVLLCQE